MLNSTTYTTRVQKFKMKFFIIITFLISKRKVENGATHVRRTYTTGTQKLNMKSTTLY